MKYLQQAGFALAFASLSLIACNSGDKPADVTGSETETGPKMKEESIQYQSGDITMNGYIVYDESQEGPRPAVFVIHEWWGMNEYAKSRARDLAKLGYVAMAIDLYGNGVTADNPKDADSLARPFYSDPALLQTRFDAAAAKLKTLPQVDASKLGAIGYCFGGAMVLNLARLGEDLKGVVSFHGNLLGVPLDTSKLKAKILVCHGNVDPFVPTTEVQKFRKEMEAAGVAYEFKSYENATHAFTNPNATAMGEKFELPIRYDAAADSASWNDMKTFFSTVF